MRRAAGVLARKKTVSAFLATAALGAVGVLAAPSASAVTPDCRVISRILPFQEGSVPANVGEHQLRLKVCWNRKGVITSSSLAQNVYPTHVGSLGGYTFQKLSTDSLHPTGGTSIAWHAAAHGRNCFGIKGVKVCGFWEQWDTVVKFYSPGFVGPLPRNVRGAMFNAHCTNKTCHFRFKNQIP